MRCALLCQLGSLAPDARAAASIWNLSHPVRPSAAVFVPLRQSMMYSLLVPVESALHPRDPSHTLERAPNDSKPKSNELLVKLVESRRAYLIVKGVNTRFHIQE